MRSHRRAVHSYLVRREPVVYAWSLTLPFTRQASVRALLAYVMRLDDLVDSVTAAPAGRQAQLEQEHQRLHQAIQADGSADPELDSVVEAMRQLRLPVDLFDRYLETGAGGFRSGDIETFADLRATMEPLAGIFASVACVALDARVGAWPSLRDLSIGWNLEDMLWDLPEDLARGRLMIPAEDLERFGVDPSVREATPAWRDLAEFEAERARGFLDRGARALDLVSRRGARALGVGLAVYADRLRALQEWGYDVFRPRRGRRWREVRTGLRALLFTRGPRRGVGRTAR